MVKKRHQDGLVKLSTLLKKVTSVLLTSNAWSSLSFATYVVHFLAKDWKLQSFILQTALFSGSHTAERLEEHAMNVCVKFFIPL